MKTVKEVPAIKAFGEVQKHAESIRNDDAHTVAIMDTSEMWVQGDVGLIRLEKIPNGANAIAKPSAQLAPGTTQGSRHVIADINKITLYQIADPTPLDGPVIDAPFGCLVDHPEHGAIALPAGVYAVIYQRAFAAELRRVQD